MRGDPEPLLVGRRLSISLPLAERTAAAGRVTIVRDVDISLNAGEVVDMVGPSGAGKTTLLRALARLVPGATGTLSLEGRPAEVIEAQRWRMLVALLPQTPVMVSGSVESNLLLPWRLKVRASEDPPDGERLKDSLSLVGLREVEPDRDASRLSVGQKARIALLRLVLTSPRVLLLDEPDANLDDASAAAVSRLTRRFAGEGGAVLRVRHTERGEAPDRVLRLAGGALTEERPMAPPEGAPDA